MQRVGGRAFQAEGSARAPRHCVERSGSHLGGSGQRHEGPSGTNHWRDMIQLHSNRIPLAAVLRTECKGENMEARRPEEAAKVVEMGGGWQEVVGFWVYGIFKGVDQIF